MGTNSHAAKYRLGRTLAGVIAAVSSLLLVAAFASGIANQGSSKPVSDAELRVWGMLAPIAWGALWGALALAAGASEGQMTAGLIGLGVSIRVAGAGLATGEPGAAWLWPFLTGMIIAAGSWFVSAFRSIQEWWRRGR